MKTENLEFSSATSYILLLVTSVSLSSHLQSNNLQAKHSPVHLASCGLNYSTKLRAALIPLYRWKQRRILGHPTPESPKPTFQPGSESRVNHQAIYSFSGPIKCPGLPRWLKCKESACNAGDPGSIPALGRSPGGRNGNPLQYSRPAGPPGVGRASKTSAPRGHPSAREGRRDGAGDTGRGGGGEFRRLPGPQTSDLFTGGVRGPLAAL